MGCAVIPMPDEKFLDFEEKNAPKHLLCEACVLLESLGKLNKTSKELQDWYNKHEKSEVARIKWEAAKKLSSRERRLLGINIDQLKKEMEVETKKNK